MSKRVIYLPSIEAHVSLGAYLQGVKRAKANPDRKFDHGLTTWWPTLGRDIMEQFREGMHDRINEGISYSDRGKFVDANRSSSQ